jgi:hypothetical protein
MKEGTITPANKAKTITAAITIAISRIEFFRLKNMYSSKIITYIRYPTNAMISSINTL